MKTKMIAIIMIPVFIALSVMGTQSFAMSDKSEQFSQGQSSVFSPGYINAAKQKTENIINQSSKPKSFIENMADYIKAKLGNRVEKNANEKLVPELKKKTGGGGPGKAVSTAAANINNIIDPSRIMQIMSDAANNGEGVMRLNNGNIISAWVDPSNQQYYMNIKNSEGATVVEKQLIGASTGQNFVNHATYMTDFGDGRFMIYMQENRPSVPSGSSITTNDYYTFYDSNDISGSAARMIVQESTSYTAGSNYVMDHGKKKLYYYSNSIGYDYITPLDDGTFVMVEKNTSWNNFNGSSETNTLKIMEIRDGVFQDRSITGDIAYNIDASQIHAMTLLGNGDLAIATTDGNHTYDTITIMDGSYNRKGSINFEDWSYEYGTEVVVSGMAGIGDDGIALNFMSGPQSLLILDTGNNFAEIGWVDSPGNTGASIQGLTGLDDGSLIINSIGYNGTGDNYLAIEKISIDADNNINTESMNISSSGALNNEPGSYRSILFRDIVDLGEGNFGVLAQEYGFNGGTYWNVNSGILPPGQNFAATQNVPTQTTNLLQSTTYYNEDMKFDLEKEFLSKGANSENTDKLNQDLTSSIMKNLLANKSLFMSGEAGADNVMLAKVIKDALGGSALAMPVGSISPEDMKIASVLASIIKNPTEDQKLLLDVAQSIMDIEGSASPELKKSSDDLLQMVAAVLIAQAIPDLLKEGDLSGIKNIFTELNTEKSKIILQYQNSAKPYYSEMIKELSKNMNILQLKDIISNKMTKDELEKIPPNELDKIVQKLRQAKDKSFEAEYILQQEAKYRKQYIDPNKKIFEDKMKDMMKGFTKKLSGVLDGMKSEKK